VDAALSRVFPAEAVDQAFAMIPPEYTRQVRASLAAMAAGSRSAAARLAALLPPEVAGKLWR